MNKIGTKTVRKIAKDLGIQTGYSWTDAPYKNENERYICIANVTNQQAVDLAIAVDELGYTDTTVRWSKAKRGWMTEYVRISKCIFEKNLLT